MQYLSFRASRLYILFGISLLFLKIEHAQAQSDSGFGTPIQAISTQSCLNESTRAAIRKELNSVIRSMEFEVADEATTEDILFESPIRQGANYDDPGFIGISNYFDHNVAYPNLVRDFFCSTRTYDTEDGYNHQGTDYFSWPFGWLKMDNNHVEVVAAAPGTIIYKQGANYDKNCSFNNTQWNAVYIRHNDGSVAWYGHLKQNSLTHKNVGDQVTVGEFLGVMGSSGNSTGPHLHLEIYDAQGNVIDPYKGSCNPTTDRSWWKEQEFYRVPMINKLTTSTTPANYGCYGEEFTHQELNFSHGQTVYFTTFFRDQITNTTSSHSILSPDGSIFQQWTTSPDVDYNASWWYRSFKLPESGSEGKWTFSSTYSGQTVQEFFYLSAEGGSIDLSFESSELVFENVQLNNTQTESFTFTNNGNVGLIITGITYPDLFKGNWNGNVHTGESKEIKVDFTPNEELNFTGELILHSNIGDIRFPIRAATTCSAAEHEVSATACLGNSYTFGTQTLTESGDYLEVFQSVNGCDSIVNLSLNYLEPIVEDVELSLCEGSTLDFGSQQISEAGDYIEVFTSSMGCDSTVNLSVDYNTLDLAITLNESTLTVAEQGASYQWYACGTNEAIPNANSQSYRPAEVGEYRVNVIKDNCDLVSDCVLVDVVLSVEINEISTALTVFPNPALNIVNVDFGSINVSGQYQLFKHSGEEVKSGTLQNQSNFELYLNELPLGIYMLRITDNDGHQSVIRVLKQ